MFRFVFVAARYLFAKKSDAGMKTEGRYLLGAALGIALSLVPIIVTLIMSEGMIQGITDRFLELGTGHLQIWQLAATRANNAAAIHNTLTTALATEGVRAAWIERQGIGIVYGTGDDGGKSGSYRSSAGGNNVALGKSGATIRAVDPSFWEDAGSSKYISVVDGTINIEKDNELLLGRELAETCGVKAGDRVRLLTLRQRDDGTSIPRATLFTVRGVVSSGYNELDSMWCIINEAQGEKLLADGLSYTYVTVKIDKPYTDADTVAQALQNALGSNYFVYTWKQLSAAQYSAYETTKQLLLFIMALIVIVAAVNVAAATSMLVIERQRDIALLKAFGTSPALTRNIFVACGFVTGITGSVAGVAGGLAVGMNINQIIHALEYLLTLISHLFNGGSVKILDPGFYLDTIPIIVNARTIVIITLGTIAAAMIASYFPARRAAKETAADLLRKV